MRGIATPFGPLLNVRGGPWEVPYIFDHFMEASIDTTADAARWLQAGTAGGVNADIMDDKPEGWIAQVTGATNNDTVQWMANGEAYKLSLDYGIVFTVEFQVVETAECEVAYGMTDGAITEVIDDTVKDGFGIWTPSSDGVLYAYRGNGTAQTSEEIKTLADASLAMSDNDVVRANILATVSSEGDASYDFHYFVENVTQGTSMEKKFKAATSSVPTGGLTPFMQIQTDNSGAVTQYINWCGAALFPLR